MTPSLSCDILEEFDRGSNQKMWKGSQRLIAITGGIASGKSSIAQYVSQVKQLPVLEADDFSHDAIQFKEPAYQKIIDRYGNEVLEQSKAKDRQIDRAALGAIIFSRKKERVWLENLIHPIVKERFLQEIKELAKSPTIILIIPLLFEADFTDLCNEIWLVDCSIENQYKRLMKRNQCSKKEAKMRIESQIDIRIKRNLADTIINNYGNTYLKPFKNPFSYMNKLIHS